MEDRPPIGILRFELVTARKDGTLSMTDFNKDQVEIATAKWVETTKDPSTASSNLFWYGRGLEQEWPRSFPAVENEGTVSD